MDMSLYDKDMGDCSPSSCSNASISILLRSPVTSIQSANSEDESGDGSTRPLEFKNKFHMSLNIHVHVRSF